LNEKASTSLKLNNLIGWFLNSFRDVFLFVEKVMDKMQRFIKTNGGKMFFFSAQADGSHWSWIGSLSEGVDRIAKDSELNDMDVLKILMDSEEGESCGNLKFSIHGEQWSVQVFELTEHP
jgi:hypothetical protein